MENTILIKEAVEKELDVVKEFYISAFRKDPSQQQISLLCGLSGSVLLQSAFYEEFESEELVDALQSNYNLLLQKLKFFDHNNGVMSTFCNGVAGFGWLSLYLTDRGFLEYENDFFTDIDPVLHRQLDKFIEEKLYDLLHGALGIALYFAKKGNFAPAEKVILALEKDAIYHKGSISWTRYDKYRALDYIHDLGLAHGIAGILYFLGKCYCYGIHGDRCKKLLSGGMQFYQQMEGEYEQHDCYFQTSVLTKDLINGAETKKTRTRLAWCYGDAGVLHTLLLIAGWLKDKALFEKYERMMVVTTKRTTLANTFIHDAQFCHGASGLSIIYDSAFQRTGNAALKKASDHWLSEVLSMNQTGSWTCGYSFHDDKQVPQPAVNILGGVGGVALNLLLYRNSKFHDHLTECLFLS